MCAPNAPESSKGLVTLTQRGLFDGIPVIVNAMLAGERLPVTVRGWLRDADIAVQRPLIDAALEGNQIALAEAAAAELPRDRPELRSVCNRTIRGAVDADRHEGTEVIGASFVELADIARFATARSQGRFVDMLIDVVASERYDEVSKVSALITLSITAPDLVVLC